ncbi:FecR family protein [Sphingobacterium griseoflavum]|uniref:Anti-sigma factor n=1 Tax=Sphingobacterium griseoflavum TaxID=1474952 RepID=A0ABQ3HX09_9SPHI|nr:FecR domain-containing protein [Sphingobacterium griseoflavum]GHE28617.1 anti-sigma factor [Sphingobacterium griseoflavum]
MDPKRKQVLLDKYLNNNLSKGEEQELSAWYDAISNGNGRWHSNNPKEERDLQDRMEQRLKHALALQSMQRAKKNILYGLCRAAALLIVLATGGYLYRLHTAPHQTFHFTNPTEENRYIVLPDNSKIIIRPRGSITVDFGTSYRAVELSGQAFFDVTKDPKRPFTVNAGRFQTSVLGTKFYIQATEGKAFLVAVKSGTVAVKDQVDHLSLAVLNKDEGIKVPVVKQGNTSTVNPPIIPCSKEEQLQERAWLENELVFQNVPLENIIDKLAKRYGKAIDIATPELRQRKISGRFDGAETLENILKTLVTVAEANYRTDTDRYLIHH